MKRQRDQIREHLERFGSITPLQALDDFGCFRLGARILELRQSGLSIDTERFKTSGGAVVARYVLKRVFRPMQQIELTGATQ